MAAPITDIPSIAFRMQDAVHYALWACTHYSFDGYESTFCGERELRHTLRNRMERLARAKRLAKECGADFGLPVPRNTAEVQEVAEWLAAGIMAWCRDLHGVDAYTSRLIHDACSGRGCGGCEDGCVEPS